MAAAVGTELPGPPDLTTVGRDLRWKIAHRTASVVDEKGKRALKLSEGPGMGLVWFDGYDFSNGVIEMDVLGHSRPVQGSFVGVAFRVVDAETHDAVYFRPFNFRVAEPERRGHAVQYASDPKWPGRDSAPNTRASTNALSEEKTRFGILSTLRTRNEINVTWEN